MPDNALPWAVQKWLNRSICQSGCGLGWAEGSTSSIVFARWRQCALMRRHIGVTWWIQFNHQSSAAMWPYLNFTFYSVFGKLLINVNTSLNGKDPFLWVLWQYMPNISQSSPHLCTSCFEEQTNSIKHYNVVQKTHPFYFLNTVSKKKRFLGDHL